MIYQGDIGLYLSGCPVPIPECMIYLTQPTVKQIVQFGETKFLTSCQILSDPEIILDEIKQVNFYLENLDDFQIIMMLLQDDGEVQDYFDTFFELVCPDYIVKYSAQGISFFLKEDESEVLKGQITPFNFEKFQTTVKELFIVYTSESDDYNPANDTAKEIYEKIKKGKKKVREQRGDNGEQVGSLFGVYASILAVGLQMDLNIFFNYTPFQLADIFNRYWAKVQSDFYDKISTTPLMDVSSVDKPEQWTKDLYGPNVEE